MAGVDDLVVCMQTAVKYSSVYIHHQIVHTSNFPIFSWPQPCGGVYLLGPNAKSERHLSWNLLENNNDDIQFLKLYGGESLN